MAQTGFEQFPAVVQSAFENYWNRRLTREERSSQRDFDLERMRQAFMQEARMLQQQGRQQEAMEVLRAANEMRRQEEAQRFRTEEEIPALREAGAFAQNFRLSADERMLPERQRIQRDSIRAYAEDLRDKMVQAAQNKSYKEFEEKFGTITISQDQYRLLNQPGNESLLSSWASKLAADMTKRDYRLGNWSNMTGEQKLFADSDLDEIFKDFYQEYEFPEIAEPEKKMKTPEPDFMKRTLGGTPYSEPRNPSYGGGILGGVPLPNR